jgi:hypothetical protein
MRAGGPRTQGGAGLSNPTPSVDYIGKPTDDAQQTTEP